MHHSVESMRDRAFLKGRTAFRSDAEYNAALRGEIDDLDETAQEQREDDGTADHYADPAEAFRDVLNGTPDLEEDDLDCIARRLKGFRDGTTGEPLVFAGHFTLKPAEISARKVVIVVDVRGEFAVEMDDALGVVSEIAKAMECAEPSSAEGIAKAVVSTGEIDNPALAELSEALVEDDLYEALDFMKDSGFDDVELDCGKFLRWRHGVIDGRVMIVVVDDPDAQSWDMYDMSDIKKAVVAADRRMRCGKLANALAELDAYDEGYSAKVLAIAKDVETGMYADGKKFNIVDEDGGWVADVSVRADGRVVVSADVYGGTVEVSREDFVKVTKKFFEGFGK